MNGFSQIVCMAVIVMTYFAASVLLALAVGAVAGWIVWWAGGVVEVSWKTSKSLTKRFVRPAAKPAPKTTNAADAEQAIKDHLTR